MPLFACRWPNGDVSFVSASNRVRAVELLDEIDNAEGCQLVPVPEFQIHLQLTDNGDFVFEELGERAENFVEEALYPAVHEAWRIIGEEQYESDNPTLTLEQQDRLRRAVLEERNRLTPKDEDVEEPKTTLGKDLKRDLDMPTSLVDKLVDQGTRVRLKKFNSKGKRH